MNFRDLGYLVAVGEYGHFGQAAEACFVSQPTLSTQIKKLERELGVQLIERTTRSARLTDIGRQIVERARIVLDQEGAIRDIAMQAQDPESGSVRMGLFPTLAPYLLPHVVPALHDRFPRMEFLLVEEKTEILVSMLGSGELDAAFMALPIPGDGFEEDELFTEPFLLAVPGDHRWAGRTDPVRLDELATEPILLLEEGHCLRDQALSVCQMAGATERVGFRATSLETLRQMVAAGVGVTLLPELAVRPPVPEPDNLSLVPFAAPVPTRRIGLFWRPTSVYRHVLPLIADEVRDIVGPMLGGPLDTRSMDDGPR